MNSFRPCAAFMLCAAVLASGALGARTKVCGPPYVDVVVMVDNSKSMSTTLYAYQASFVDKLQDALFASGQDNRMWLYKFDYNPTLLKAKATSKFSWNQELLTGLCHGSQRRVDRGKTGF